MELSFENHYVVGITIFMLAMLFCGKLVKLLTAMFDGLEKCFLACFQGLLNSLIEGASPRKSIALTKLRLRECTFSVVVTE